MPFELRQRGIASQRELVMALLPYMEWVQYDNLRTRFWKFIAHQHNDGPIRRILFDLKNQGLIEKKYGDSPEPPYPGMKPHPYLYIRRVSRVCPSNHDGRHKKLDGTYGIDAELARARLAKKGKPKKPKKSLLHLTMDDVKFIHSNPHGHSLSELAGMFTIWLSQVQEIRKGHIPAHLKGRPVQ